jgi:glutamine amidotransferase
MESLRESGLEDLAIQAAGDGRPFMGICVGMQMLYESSVESPGAKGLGVLPGPIVRLPEGVKRPQMQWNVLDVKRESPLLAGLPDPAWVYFVHSFAPEDATDAVATCDYGGPVVAAVERGTVWATQFHPEKSAANGLRILANFVDRCAERGS